MATSVGESRIISILNAAGIKFIREKTFEDLHHGLYRYDFYLPEENILLEYNGQQHYECTKFFYKKRSDFQKAQERDRRKISFALASDIPLYCIPYWDSEILLTYKDLIKDEYHATTKFHNDDAWHQQKSKLLF